MGSHPVLHELYNLLKSPKDCEADMNNTTI